MADEQGKNSQLGEDTAVSTNDSAEDKDEKIDAVDNSDKKAEDEDEEEKSSKFSNIVAVVFIVGLVAFNVYTFVGYKNYGAPEVSPDKPVAIGIDETHPALADGGVPEPASKEPASGAPAVTDTLGASGLSSQNNALNVAKNVTAAPPPGKNIAPPPGKRPEPAFSNQSKMKKADPGISKGAVLPGTQFLIGVSALSSDDSVALSAEQKEKCQTVLKSLAQDQEAISTAATESVNCLSTAQLDWIIANRGMADVSDVEPEVGFDPTTTAYMHILRSKKGDDGKKLVVAKHSVAELNFQDVMDGVIKIERSNKELALTTAQAQKMLAILMNANKARQTEAMHFQQLRDILSEKQLNWIGNHPEKTVMNVNAIVIKYVEQTVK